MPIYDIQVSGSLKVEEVFMNLQEFDKAQMKDGRVKLSDGRLGRVVFNSRPLVRSSQWALGHRSKAMAVAPQDAEYEENRLRKATGYKGIRVDRKTGEVITYSQRQKVAAAKAQGCVDLDSYC